MRVLPANAPPRIAIIVLEINYAFVRLQGRSLARAERHPAFAAQDRALRASRYVSGTLFARGRLRKLAANSILHTGYTISVL